MNESDKREPQPSAKTLQLSSRGARAHFAVAIALVSEIPLLTLVYLFSISDASRPFTISQGALAGLGVGISMLSGYILLARYPATIIRLRACLHTVANGDLPDAIDLSAQEQDVMAIEDALNVVLARLHERLHVTQAQKVRLEDELFQAQKLEAIGTLAAGISHEINTPLQFVSNNAQFLGKACRDLLADTGPAPESAEAQRAFLRAETPRSLEQLEAGIARISEIVGAIRDFARGNTDETRVPVDLNAAIRTTVELTRNEWKYHADIESALDPDLPPVPCYPAEIKRTLLNLIRNAVQAIVDQGKRSERAKGLIRIATRRQGNEVLLSVSDDGCGIPVEIRDRIFEPFFTTRAIGAGKGCGLSYAHAAVVKRHGGHLGFVTEVGSGSTFTVSLPLDDERPDGIVRSIE